MIGKTFNNWTVIGPAESKHGKKYWQCQCKCGTTKAVCGSDLKNNKSKSCGCLRKSPNKIDLTNQKFGRLTVIKENGRTASKCVLWLCECECGKQINVRTADLRNGHTKSCGCYQKEKTSEVSRMNIKEGTRFGKLVTTKDFKMSEDKKGTLRKCICDCGNEKWIPTHYLMQGISSCGCGVYSKGEIKIENILKENNIDFIKEYTDTLVFTDTNKKARFDFYIPSKKLIIEYDGVQHYKNGTGIFDNVEKFKKTKEHDKIKNQWCKDNNIKLIRIPYTHYQTLCLEDLLIETSSFLI